RAMPAMKKIAQDYADQGVVLYAVNQGEDAEQVRRFLKDQNLQNLNVAMDTSMAVGRAYQAHGIPQTVIIDRQGVVRHVSVGFGAGTEQQLRRKLDSILA